jgi:hypothetical protein
VRLRDAAGAVVGEFVFEQHPEGGVLRVGKGKLTVNTKDVASPRVRYWHPDREFKWKRGQWTFLSRMADRGDRNGRPQQLLQRFVVVVELQLRASRRGAAVAGGIAAAGGTFDGGGASAAWDGASAMVAVGPSDSGGGTATAY